MNAVIAVLHSEHCVMATELTYLNSVEPYEIGIIHS